MNPDEYAAQQALISAAVARYTLTFGKLFSQPVLTLAEWLGLLEFVYPQIEFHRTQAATLARQFYDDQRLLHHPELPTHKVPLEGYSMARFIRDMEPARDRMSQADAPDDAIAQVALQAVRSVENAGRQQIIHAVKDEPEEKIIHGWARVATGRETCSWCLMLVSRGPVYMGADTAGLDLDDDTAERMIAAGEDVSEHMEKWHAGCDCKVVPVYKVEEWPGKAAADRALELWNEATKTAIQEEESDPDRTHNHGKNKGDTFTRNERAINALRRRLANGEIDPAEFAGFQAAA